MSTYSLPSFIVASFRNRSWRWDLFVFLSYLLTAKLAQYILLTLHTSPALIWAPAGIALAAVLIKGYRMWIPIALAHVIAVITLPSTATLTTGVISAIAFTIQALVGAWILRFVESDGSVHRTRDVIRLVLGSFVIAATGPLLSTLGQHAIGILSVSIWLSFSRAWAGSVLGILIMTPLVTGWYYSPYWPIARGRTPEAINAFLLLGISIYLLFWTSLSTELTFPLIFLLCIALFWIALRFGSRVTVTSMTILAVFGIMGSIVAHPNPTPLNQQVFADELFIVLLAPIFYLFFTLMEERRIAEQELGIKVHELERLTSKLSDADKAKNEFIAILAHELRNPLSAVMNALELLKMEKTSSEASEMIELGESQSHAMQRLLDDLLDVARITEKKLNVQKTSVELGALVARCAKAMEHKMHVRKHALAVSIPEQPTIVSADAVRLEQVVNNLLNNAAKYTQDGGTIGLVCVTEGGWARIEVRDNGIGIPPDKLDTIFSAFSQLNDASRRSSGIGVGLFLTQQIVALHDGTITASSEGAGKGSTFVVTLPIAK